MALNAVELKMLHRVIGTMDKPRVLFLGYPDLLCDQASCAMVDLAIPFGSLPTRPESQRVWKDHSRNLSIPMLETKALFRHWGANPFVCDAIRWGGEDAVLDLNQPAPAAMENQFDIVVDPGTVEHCFNVAQTFQNIVRFLKPGGLVYHQAALAFPNHGFWSISPTTFYDFYQSQGFKLGVGYLWGGGSDPNGFVPRIKPLHPFSSEGYHSLPAIGSFAFRKWASPGTDAYPIQRVYSSISRIIQTKDYIGDALGPEVMARLTQQFP